MPYYKRELQVYGEKAETAGMEWGMLFARADDLEKKNGALHLWDGCYGGEVFFCLFVCLFFTVSRGGENVL